MELKGKIKSIYNEKSIPSGKVKKDFVLELQGNSQYPDMVVVSAWSDSAKAELASKKVGDFVTAIVDFKVNEWKGKDGEPQAFQNTSLYKFAEGAAAPVQQAAPAPKAQPKNQELSFGDDNDLPF